ncbi:MAG TPA: GTPase ObgE [Candidatus Sulfotelmatobacter sp.]|nr:GTPase ObgE [Candidatus Sulfotelmatobacter sp.]
MFLDHATIWVAAGAGGAGAATFRREAHVPRGGPDGGDGGRGGSVYLRVDAGQTTLQDYRFKHHFRAPAGGAGAGAKRHGRAGRDVELAVPPGTAVFDRDSGDLLADLVVPGQRVMVARGGRGGLGNVHFATATHRTPRHAQRGEPAEERWLRLELRLIADIGLVGLPNAGKSTLLAALTAATPRIAAYPFTTIEPNLGVLDLARTDPDEARRFTIADVPGLIEGASGGAGLGHAFLRHVERTRVLLHVVDAAAPTALADHDTIREELRLHDPALLAKPGFVVANKIDLPGATQRAAALGRHVAADGEVSVAVSAMTGQGLTNLVDRLRLLLPAAGSQEAVMPAGVVVHRFEQTAGAFSVLREGDGYRVRGRRIERLAAQTDFDNEESAERFQRDLERLGVDRELRRAGVTAGDTVRIGSYELAWGDEPWV